MGRVDLMWRSGRHRRLAGIPCDLLFIARPRTVGVKMNTGTESIRSRHPRRISKRVGHGTAIDSRRMRERERSASLDSFVIHVVEFLRFDKAHKAHATRRGGLEKGRGPARAEDGAVL